MNKLILVMGAILISHTVFAAEIHQCNVNGSVVFQANPCAGGGRTAADLVRENREAEKVKQEQLAKREAEIRDFNSRPFPYIGMSSSTKTVWGEPATKNTTRTARGTREQWVYRWGGKSKYLYFENGILTTISE